MDNIGPIRERLRKAMEDLGLSLNAVSTKAGLSNGLLGQFFKGAGIGLDKIESILAAFPEIDKIYVYTGLRVASKEGKNQFETPQETMQGNMQGFMQGLAKNQFETPQKTEYEELHVAEEDVTYLIEPKNARIIPITDIQAAAGSGVINEQEINSLEVMSLPSNFLKGGNHLCIRIKGNSMAPTLQDGGFMVIRHIERSDWPLIPDGHIYVIGDTEGKTYIKRVKNRFAQGFIVLTSDNPDKASYPSINLQHNEVQSIWYAEWYLSAKMPNIHDQFYSKLSRLEDSVESLTFEMQDLKKHLPPKTGNK